MADKVSGWRVFARALERVVVVANIPSDVCFLGRCTNSWGVFTSSVRISEQRFGTPVGLNTIRSVFATA
jgi:hypothetical protein